LGRNRSEIDHREIAAAREITALVEHVGNSARHARGKVAPRLADDQDEAARHVFAAMIADTFDDRNRPRIAYRKAFAGNAAEIAFSRNRTIEDGVAHDDRLLGLTGHVRMRPDDELAAGKPLADIVVGLAYEIECDAMS